MNLPTNSSISVTLSQKDLRTLTTVNSSRSFERDSLYLNGVSHDIDNDRTTSCLKHLRLLRQQLEEDDPNLPKISQWKLHIISENNFPTAAGLASSAAGFAAMVAAISRLYELPQDASELSRIARKGSGSACRSMFGGYVAWEMGEKPDGSDSKAVQIAPSEHWPNMKAAICIVSDLKKMFHLRVVCRLLSKRLTCFSIELVKSFLRDIHRWLMQSRIEISKRLVH